MKKLQSYKEVFKNQLRRNKTATYLSIFALLLFLSLILTLPNYLRTQTGTTANADLSGYGSLSTAVLTPPSSGTYAYNTFGPADPNFPAVGQSYTDPVFGTTIRRLSNIYPPASNLAGSGLIYSRNSLWNANGTRYLTDALVNSPGVEVIDTTTGAVVRANVPYPVTTHDEVAFDPINQDVYYYTNGTNLRQYNIATGVSSVAKTFSATLGGLGQTTDWIDNSGRYFLLNVGGIFKIWDKQTDTLYGNVPVPTGSNGIPPGWAALSPDSKYLIVALTPQHYSYAIDHVNKSVGPAVLFWDACDDHGDIMSASNGKTYLISQGCYFDDSAKDVQYRIDVSLNQAGRGALQLNDAIKLVEWTRPVVGGNPQTIMSHYSCASRGENQDWCYISSEYPDETLSDMGAWFPYKQEIMAAHLLPPYEINRLAHHRSRPLPQSGEGYCRQPRVNTNWDGTQVAFTSNFGQMGNTTDTCGYSDLYMINFTQGGGTPTPTPTPSPTPGSTPFSGTPYAIPGTFEVENFDNGGEGIAYHDMESANQGSVYRTTEGVDIQATTDTGGGYNVGWLKTGEWMKYTVNVNQGGTYTLGIRLANAETGAVMHVEIDGVNVTGSIAVPNTGGYQVWQTLNIPNINLSAGQHVMRVVADAPGASGYTGNLNSFTWTAPGVTQPPTLTPTNTPIPPTPTPTSTADTTKPTVTITSPANGSTVVRNQNITVQATASDNKGVTKVEFRRNGTLVCTDTTTPYSCSMFTDTKKGRNVTYEARAFDAAGNNNSVSINVTTN